MIKNDDFIDSLIYYVESEKIKNMKNIKLRIGDKLTYRNGKTNYVNRLDKYSQYYDNTFKHLHDSNLDIMKIERFLDTSVGVFDITGDNYYRLKTIYERKEPILDSKEKEWLKNFIKSTNIKVISIKKNLGNNISEYLSIYYFNDYEEKRKMFLPNFAKETMYKNMKLFKEYTIKELGIDIKKSR